MHGAHGAPGWRVEFIDGKRSELRSEQPSLSIGSGADCDIVLPSHESAAQHLMIQRDQRGIVLQVAPSAARVYVNARPVRECALLRLGDVVSIGSHKLLLKQASDELGQTHRAHRSADGPPGLAALRAVAGPLAGRRLPVDEDLLLDGQLLPGCSGSVTLQRGRTSIDFEVRTATGESDPPRFNGIAARAGRLHVGDQLAWHRHRFLIEAPGIALSEDHVAFVPREEKLPEQTAGPANEVWWLIVTAALLALAIALLLLLKL